MEQNVKISVIIPIYNTEKYLYRCLDSLMAQTYTNFEVLLIDDGSTDSSSEICQQYVNRDHHFSYVYQKNQGSGMARNNGMSHATGEYLYFMDSDDEIERNTFEILVRKIVDKNFFPEMILFGHRAFSKGSELRRSHLSAQVIQSKTAFEQAFNGLFTKGGMFTVWNKLYLTSRIKEIEIQFPNSKRGQDYLFNLSFYPFVNQALIVPDIFYTYYIENEGAATTTLPQNYHEIIINEYHTLEKLLNEFHLSEIEKQQIFNNENKRYLTRVFGTLIRNKSLTKSCEECSIQILNFFVKEQKMNILQNPKIFVTYLILRFRLFTLGSLLKKIKARFSFIRKKYLASIKRI